MSKTQSFVDKFYKDNGPCCAGCDFWRFHNSVVGECIKSAPVGGDERYSMTGVKSCSMEVEAGHIMTERHHLCGDFNDSELLS